MDYEVRDGSKLRRWGSCLKCQQDFLDRPRLMTFNDFKQHVSRDSRPAHGLYQDIAANWMVARDALAQAPPNQLKLEDPADVIEAEDPDV
jgi:hypothetical protein